jgi:cytochrome c-type biogenesis protein CcmH/NrfG
MSDLKSTQRPSVRRRWIFNLFLLLVFAGGCYGACWAYEKYKGRQSKHLTKMAAEYLKKGKVEEGTMSLETAIRLKPKNAEALRLMARLQGAVGEGPKSLDAWRKLAERGFLTLEDLAHYALTAAREGDWALADGQDAPAHAGSNGG